MTIGICDDIKEHRDIVIKLSEDYFEKNNLNYKLVEFISGKEVLCYKEELDLLILDIEMDGLDGIEVKEYLAMEGKETAIIFMTSHGEQINEAFGKNVFGFVDKRGDIKKIYTILDKVLDHLTNYIQIEAEKNGISSFIRSDSIIRMEIINQYIDIYTISDVYIKRDSFKNMESQLREYGFYRIDRRHMVNLKFIDTVQKGIKLKNGYQYHTSNRIYNKFKKAYGEYIMKKAR